MNPNVRMKGKHRPGLAPHQLEEGEYAKWSDGKWYAHCPGEHDLVANLGSHTILEHEDGTITTSQSILCRGAPGEEYHGFLVKGDWYDA